jgi:hypothetical protein
MTLVVIHELFDELCRDHHLELALVSNRSRAKKTIRGAFN